jgi:inorganic pyrophosphatase
MLAVAANSLTHQSIRALRDVNDDLVSQIEHFFVSYNMARGKTFMPRGRSGRDRASAIVKGDRLRPKTLVTT